MDKQRTILRHRWLFILTACLFCSFSSTLVVAQNYLQTPYHHAIPSLFIVGDSTANIHGDATLGDKQRVGWGTPFASYFDFSKIRIVNAARAGRSSRTFMNEGRWAAVLEQLKPGDFVLIQFGHNDPGPVATGKGRGSLPGIGDKTQAITDASGKKEMVHTFGWYLRKYIADTRAKRAIPIVLSVTPRNIWTDEKVERGLGHYREWAAQVAHQEDVDYVDVTGIVAREYEKLGPSKVNEFFGDPHTHTNLSGAEMNARLVVKGLHGLKHQPLKSYMSKKGTSVR